MATNTGTAVGYTATNITGQATTVLRTGKGILHSIAFGGPVATGTVAIYDNTSGTGTLIGTITTPASPLPFVWGPIDAEYTTGLTIVTAVASQNITVTYV